tara:strand:- start:622 stop:1008 length:387 start_codon:yes stop_codon:yes gene_type:complete
MPYRTEQRKVTNTIRKAGNNAALTIRSISSRHPISGFPVTTVSAPIFFAQVNYNGGDLNDTSIADGLTKLVLAPLDASGNEVVDFNNIVSDKSGIVIFPNGVESSIQNTRITSGDTVTPIAARLFLGS